MAALPRASTSKNAMIEIAVYDTKPYDRNISHRRQTLSASLGDSMNSGSAP